MNRDQYETVANMRPDVSLTVKEYAEASGRPLTEQRTLLYGYNVERETFHVYLLGCEIHRLIYTSRGVISYMHAERWGNADVLAPDKRIYPERTDYSFARLLKSKGVHVSFTTFPPNDDTEPEPKHGMFHGLTHFDFPQEIHA